MDFANLEQIGLTKSEVKVYLALLRIGQNTAGRIVDEAKITRSKIYDILERLKNKGLVSHIIKDSTKYFSAADPANLMSYVEEKEKDIESEKKIISEILPKLQKEYTSAIEKQIAEVFVGMKGMHNAFSVLVKEFDSRIPFLAFGAGEGEDIEQIQKFFTQLHKERVKKKVKTFIVYTESARGLFLPQEKSRFVEARYLIHSSPAAISIYKNYTIITILLKEPITLLIRNKEASDSFKEYFNIIWKHAKL